MSPQPGRATRPSSPVRPRRALRARRLSVVAATVLVAGLASGAGSRADEARPPVALAYDCPLPEGAPSGSTRATVEVGTRAPAAVDPGEPIAPGPVDLSATLPYDELEPLLPEGTTAVTGEAALAVRVRQNDESAQTSWAPLTTPDATPVPAEGGELRLDHTGQVPSVTVGAPGEVAFTAGELALAVGPSGDAGAGDGAGSVTLTCALAEGQDGLLAEVTARPGPGDGGPGGPGTEEPGEEPNPDEPGAGIDVGGRGKAAAPVDGCPDEWPEGEVDLTDAPPPLPGTVLRPPVGSQAPVCAYAVGFGTVRKLDGSMIINDPGREPALMNIWANKRIVTSVGKPLYTSFGSLGTLELPDAETAFLAFGFTPVTAKVRFETGPISIGTGTVGSPPSSQNYAFASFEQRLRIHDVKVNGTPLDVGSKCGTAKPYRVTLRGSFGPGGTGSYKNVLQGGLLTAKVDIPRFSGCGSAGEDLDALFTAAISGPGNSIAMNQAQVCSPAGVGRPGCPAVVPPLPSLTLPPD